MTFRALLFRGLAFAFLVLAGSAASAAVLTFDAFEAAGTGATLHSNPVDVGEFRFTAVGGTGGGVPVSFQTGSPSYNGSAALTASNNADILMTRIDGGTFAVVSIDVDRLFSDVAFEFVGDLSGGGQVTQQFSADGLTGNQTVVLAGFQNLTALTLGAVGSAALANVGTVDNIQVGVPEPATLAIFGLALVGFGMARRRWARRTGKIRSVAVGLFTAAAMMAAMGVTAPSVLAAPVTTPTGLNPGDQFRLAFVTSTGRDATSTAIADYNAFVNNIGFLATGISGWTAIASTATVAARDNTGTNPGSATGVGIYLLDGTTKIANNNAELWNTAIDNLLNVDENGTPNIVATPWTGTSDLGTIDTDLFLGNTATRFGSSFGNTARSDSGWIFHGNTALLADSRPLYALSGILTVPARVPEPAMAAIFGLALAGLGVARRRRPRQGP